MLLIKAETLTQLFTKNGDTRQESRLFLSPSWLFIINCPQQWAVTFLVGKFSVSLTIFIQAWHLNITLFLEVPLEQRMLSCCCIDLVFAKTTGWLQNSILHKSYNISFSGQCNSRNFKTIKDYKKEVWIREMFSKSSWQIFLAICKDGSLNISGVSKLINLIIVTINRKWLLKLQNKLFPTNGFWRPWLLFPSLGVIMVIYCFRLNEILVAVGDNFSSFRWTAAAESV